MQIRCNVQIDSDFRKVILASQENETPQHLALKLAAFVLFFKSKPLMDVSLKHPAIAGQEFRPDLLALNESGEVQLWVECGTVTSHKLDKLPRRYRNARIITLKETYHEAETLRKTIEKHKVQGADRVEIWAFPNRMFQEWFNAVAGGDEVSEEAKHSPPLGLSEAVPFGGSQRSSTGAKRVVSFRKGTVDIVGESAERSFNLVVNAVPLQFDFLTA